MSSRTEELIEALLNGTTVDFTPQSRVEAILKSAVNGMGTSDLPDPNSRIEALLYRLAEVIGNGGVAPVDETQAYILQDEAGNEFPAFLVEEATVFTATANDIREGSVAGTESGVTVGTKEIPAYHTTEGYQVITSGSDMKLTIKGRYDYAKLQAIVCAYNTSPDNSVAAEYVVIDDHIYAVGSTEALADVTIDADSQSINLGLKNETSNIYFIRFFTYKEEY